MTNKPEDAEFIVGIALSEDSIENAAALVFMGSQMTGELASEQDISDVLEDLNLEASAVNIEAVRSLLVR
jgi:hypothetical protein